MSLKIKGLIGAVVSGGIIAAWFIDKLLSVGAGALRWVGAGAAVVVVIVAASVWLAIESPDGSSARQTYRRYQSLKAGLWAAYAFFGVMCVPALLWPGFLIPPRHVIVFVFVAVMIKLLAQSIALLILCRGDKK